MVDSVQFTEPDLAPVGPAMRMERDGDLIVLRVPEPYGVRVRDGIPGARYNSGKRYWTLPLSWGACVTARGVLGDGLEVGPKLAQWSRDEYANRVAPCMALRSAKDLPDGWDRLFRQIEGTD